MRCDSSSSIEPIGWVEPTKRAFTPVCAGYGRNPSLVPPPDDGPPQSLRQSFEQRHHHDLLGFLVGDDEGIGTHVLTRLDRLGPKLPRALDGLLASHRHVRQLGAFVVANDPSALLDVEIESAHARASVHRSTKRMDNCCGRWRD